MGRVAATLFAIGSALTLLGLLLPHSPKVDADGFWAIAGGTTLGACLLFRYPQRLSRASYEACMLLAAATITLALYFNGERHGAPSAGNQVLYVWIALYAGYFFSTAALARQLIAIAGLYAGELVLVHPGSVAPTRWLITMGMASAAALIVHALKVRNDDLLASLSNAARTDSLTGLLNRHGFDERLALELARAGRTGQPLALIVADIDRFKEINDRSGHAAGDAALRRVAEMARRAARGHDTIARIGGDEFAAILPDTDAEGAFTFAERVREMTAATPPGADGVLTMSLGIAESHSGGLTPDILTRSADEALYEAKNRGRDQTVVHGVVPATIARRARHLAAPQPQRARRVSTG